MGKTLRMRYDVTTGQVQIEMSLTEWVNLREGLAKPEVENVIRKNGGYESTLNRLIRANDNLQGALSRTVEPLDLSHITAWIPGWWVTPEV